jgi:uncharacterized protein with PIN domain
MATATIRFYEELNDFLPARKQKQDLTVVFTRGNSVKDMIESLGVPHTEIDLILVNHAPVDFSYKVRDQDMISVYPIFETFDISTLNRLRPEPLRRVRFILDTHLGKLARYLRMLGFDTLYDNRINDIDLAKIAGSGGQRIVLTRDVGLLKHKRINHGYFVRATQPRKQLVELLDRFDLRRQVTPFKRCVHCNGLLEPVQKPAVRGQVPEGIYRKFQVFVRCSCCGQIYWQGSHYERMHNYIRMLLRA